MYEIPYQSKKTHKILGKVMKCNNNNIQAVKNFFRFLRVNYRITENHQLISDPKNLDRSLQE